MSEYRIKCPICDKYTNWLGEDSVIKEIVKIGEDVLFDCNKCGIQSRLSTRQIKHNPFNSEW